MATKTPAKGKKAEKGKASAPKKARAGKAAPVEAKEPEPPEVDSDAEDDDEDDDLDDETPRPAAAVAGAKKPAPAGRPATKTPATGDDAPQVVPARRLTAEAKAKINELVKKGMPLQDALRAAGAWETFVAPVREEPAKLVQGRSFEGGGRPPSRPKTDDDGDRDRDRQPHDDSDEEPAGSPSGGDDD